MAMTIEMVRDWAAKTPASNGWQAKERDDAVAALTAHLSQPAQGVECPECNGLGYTVHPGEACRDNRQRCDACNGTGTATHHQEPNDGDDA